MAPRKFRVFRPARGVSSLFLAQAPKSAEPAAPHARCAWPAPVPAPRPQALSLSLSLSLALSLSRSLSSIPASCFHRRCVCSSFIGICFILFCVALYHQASSFHGAGTCAAAAPTLSLSLSPALALSRSLSLPLSLSLASIGAGTCAAAAPTAGCSTLSQTWSRAM